MVTLIPILCSLLLINFVHCEDRIVVSKEQIKEIGEDAEFNCTAQRNNSPLIWFKLDKEGQNGVLLSTNEMLIINDPKFNLTYYEDESKYSLKVKNLQESDTGFYQCQLLLSVQEKLFKNVELQIRRPPSITNATTSGVVTEGSAVELICKADGYPKPTITWRRADNDLFFNGSEAIESESDKPLTIPKSKRDDRGVYYCTASNNAGQEDKANVTVVIEFAPVVTAVRPRLGQARDSDAYLRCHVEAYPAPVVTWLRGSEVLNKDESRDQDDKFIATYAVYAVRQTDYGQYVCRAENKLGVRETIVELYETHVPFEEYQ